MHQIEEEIKQIVVRALQVLMSRVAEDYYDKGLSDVDRLVEIQREVAQARLNEIWPGMTEIHDEIMAAAIDAL